MDAQAMTKLYLAEPELILLVCSVGASLAAGALIGAFYFLTLRWNVRMFATGQSLPLALAIQLVRFAVIAGALAVIAVHFGAMPLLVVTAGVLATRTAIVRIGVRP
jgi:F1F0 ATPase subunit 2